MPSTTIRREPFLTIAILHSLSFSHLNYTVGLRLSCVEFTGVVTRSMLEEQFWAQALRWEIELTDGEVHHLSSVALKESLIVTNLYRILYPFCTAKRIGYVFREMFYVTERALQGRLLTVRQIDFSFIRYEKLNSGFDLMPIFSGGPDLAVEVVAPQDQAEAVQGRVQEYLACGSEQVWVLYPGLRTAHQFSRDKPNVAQFYRQRDLIDTESLFPGLRLVTSDLFAMPDIDLSEPRAVGL